MSNAASGDTMLQGLLPVIAWISVADLLHAGDTTTYTPADECFERQVPPAR